MREAFRQYGPQNPRQDDFHVYKRPRRDRVSHVAESWRRGIEPHVCLARDAHGPVVEPSCGESGSR